MQLSAFLCLQEQAAKEALAAELAARGIVVEEGKKKARNTFGQSNSLFTILSPYDYPWLFQNIETKT